MNVTEAVNMVTTFVIATGPIAVTIGVLGHALVASRFPFLRRVGKILEGIGWDMKRVSEAFKRGPKDPPDDPPGGDQTPVAAKPIPSVVLPTGGGLPTLALAFVMTGCGLFGSDAASTADEVCAEEIATAQARCIKVAFEKCGAYSEDPDACPRAAEVDAQCDAFVDEEVVKCN